MIDYTKLKGNLTDIALITKEVEIQKIYDNPNHRIWKELIKQAKSGKTTLEVLIKNDFEIEALRRVGLCHGIRHTPNYKKLVIIDLLEKETK